MVIVAVTQLAQGGMASVAADGVVIVPALTRLAAAAQRVAIVPHHFGGMDGSEITKKY